MLTAREAKEMYDRSPGKKDKTFSKNDYILFEIEMKIRERITFHGDNKLWLSCSKKKPSSHDDNAKGMDYWLSSKVTRDSIIKSLEENGYKVYSLDTEDEYNLIIKWAEDRETIKYMEV